MSSGTTGAPGPKPRIHERVIILVNATASEQYNCIRRLTEALVFTVTIVFIIVYELHHDTFKEKSREVLAVDVVKWFWLLASNCYLWFILIAEHVIRDLLPLQPLAMAMLIVGYFAYAAFVCVDLRFYWGLGTIAQSWIILTAFGVPFMLAIICRLRQLENGDETALCFGAERSGHATGDVEEGRYLLEAQSGSASGAGR